MSQEDPEETSRRTARRHLVFGWLLLLAFSGLGIALELLHGFKVGWYVDGSSETRRLMWRLAHAHGTFLALVNIAFGLTLERVAGLRGLPVASFSMLAAAILLPLGFFLGGLRIYGGDPSLGVFIGPFGAAFLAVGVAILGVELVRIGRR